eukprot:symbB.v1.2.000595.t1/scaffold26.1/size418576/10
MATYGQGTLRPKAPLQIPCFLSWSEEDDSKQFSNYEDLALYIHPKFRRIYVLWSIDSLPLSIGGLHNQGHRPPNFQKGTKECELLDAFIGEMQAGTLHSGRPRAGRRRYVQGVVVPDPLGEHGPLPDAASDRNRFPAQEAVEVCAKRLDAFRQVTGCKGSDFDHEGVQLISVLLPWPALEDLTVKLLQDIEITPGDNIAVLGLGRVSTVGFSGSLLTTPVCYLTCPESVAGPPWRLETATYGPFVHRHFEDKASLLAAPAMVKRHVKGGKAMKKFGGQKSKSQPWKVKSVIQKATAKSEVTTTPKPTKPDVKMAPAKAEKASKLSKKDRRKQRAEAVKMGERSPKATPQASPKAKIASPPKTPAGSPKMIPEMEVDAEKTKKQRRKDQRRNIQVKKTQMKKKGNY